MSEREREEAEEIGHSESLMSAKLASCGAKVSNTQPCLKNMYMHVYAMIND